METIWGGWHPVALNGHTDSIQLQAFCAVDLLHHLRDTSVQSFKYTTHERFITPLIILGKLFHLFDRFVSEELTVDYVWLQNEQIYNSFPIQVQSSSNLLITPPHPLWLTARLHPLGIFPWHRWESPSAPFDLYSYLSVKLISGNIKCASKQNAKLRKDREKDKLLASTKMYSLIIPCLAQHT